LIFFVRGASVFFLARVYLSLSVSSVSFVLVFGRWEFWNARGAQIN